MLEKVERARDDEQKLFGTRPYFNEKVGPEGREARHRLEVEPLGACRIGASGGRAVDRLLLHAGRLKLPVTAPRL